MKLGYFSTVTSAGYDDERWRLREGRWCSVVDDERTLWRKYAHNNESVAMTFTEDGLVLAIAYITGGDRADDNIATWVFIPSKIQISGAQIKKVIETVKAINKGGSKNITEEAFLSDPILNAEYQERIFPLQSFRSVGTVYAQRYPTNDYTLDEILDEPYQKYYSRYKYVFLLNQESEKIVGLQDLSKDHIQKDILVLPPSKEVLRSLFGTSEVTIKFNDGTPFVSPKWMANNQKPIDLTIERTGFISKTLKGQALKDESEIELFGGNSTWRKRIPQEVFEVYDKDRDKLLSNARVSIEDPAYDIQERSLPENRLNSVQVHVTAEGYKNYRGNVDLSKGKVKIPMKIAEERAEYELETPDGHTIKVEMRGPKVKEVCPFEGYRFSPQKNKLVKKSQPKNNSGSFQLCGDKNDNRWETESSNHRGFAWKEFFYGVATVIGLAIIGWGCFKGYELISQKFLQKEENSTVYYASEDAAEPPYENEITAPSSYIAYLDNKEGKWDRDSLIKYPELQGLFEALNSYDFNKVMEYHSTLSPSEQFMAVYNAIKQNEEKKFGDSFNSEGDYIITVENYINKLNKPIESTPEVDQATSKRNEDTGKTTTKQKSSKTSSSTKQIPQKSSGEQPKKKKGRAEVD